MENCVFCKIINQEIPSYKIYEDEVVYAFLDLTQTTKGHTLIIPKQHVVDIFDYDSQLAGDFFARVPKIARALEKAFPDMGGLNIVNNNKALAYQSVFHSHLHLLPRYEESDDFSLTFKDNSSQYTVESMMKLAETIKGQVRN